MTREGDPLILKGLHIDGPGAGSLGLRELRNLTTDLGRQQGPRLHGKGPSHFGGLREGEPPGEPAYEGGSAGAAPSRDGSSR